MGGSLSRCMWDYKAKFKITFEKKLNPPLEFFSLGILIKISLNPNHILCVEETKVRLAHLTNTDDNRRLTTDEAPSFLQLLPHPRGVCTLSVVARLRASLQLLLLFCRCRVVGVCTLSVVARLRASLQLLLLF